MPRKRKKWRDLTPEQKRTRRGKKASKPPRPFEAKDQLETMVSIPRVVVGLIEQHTELLRNKSQIADLRLMDQTLQAKKRRLRGEAGPAFGKAMPVARKRLDK